MPLGILSDEEYAEELEKLSPKKPAKAEIVQLPERGRNGKEEVPDSVRKIVASCALNGEDRQLIESTFGVSQSSISAYKNGATSTASYHKPDEVLAQHVDTVKKGIVKKANNRIMRALNSMKNDKFESASLRDLSGVAKDMSAVIRNLEPQREAGSGNNAQFVFFSPKLKDESDYKIINVKD